MTQLSHIESEAREAQQDWSAGGRVHNWRNYVGEHVRALWPALTEGVRVAIALDADELAMREDWE